MKPTQQTELTDAARDIRDSYTGFVAGLIGAKSIGVQLTAHPAQGSVVLKSMVKVDDYPDGLPVDMMKAALIFGTECKAEDIVIDYGADGSCIFARAGTYEKQTRMLIAFTNIKARSMEIQIGRQLTHDAATPEALAMVVDEVRTTLTEWALISDIYG